jgi:ribonuclease P protein component
MKKGYDIVLVARGKTATAPWNELNSTFTKLCKKLDLLEEQT